MTGLGKSNKAEAGSFRSVLIVGYPFVGADERALQYREFQKTERDDGLYLPAVAPELFST